MKRSSRLAQLGIFRRFHFTEPLQTALLFVTVMVVLDVVVVAGLIERSFDMFKSFTGTWLVFALIFIATWLTGRVVRRELV